MNSEAIAYARVPHFSRRRRLTGALNVTTHQDPPIPNTDHLVVPTTTPRTGAPDHGADALTDTGSHPALDVTVHERSAHHGSLDKVVFGVTAVIAVAFLIWGFLSTASLADVSGKSLTWTMENTGWLFVLTASGFVVFVLWLAMSRYGNITLGRDGEEPEFRTVSWIAMMFSAGMGIGLMFYGVSEPISQFSVGCSASDQAETEALVSPIQRARKGQRRTLGVRKAPLGATNHTSKQKGFADERTGTDGRQRHGPGDCFRGGVRSRRPRHAHRHARRSRRCCGKAPRCMTSRLISRRMRLVPGRRKR